MLECSHIFVHLYSRLADGDHVVAMTLHPSGECAEIQVYHRGGDSASCVLTEGNLTILKNGCHPLISWTNFFELLQKAFADHTVEYQPPQLKITVKHERQTDAVPIPPFSTSLVVPIPKLSHRGDALYELAAGMVSFAAVRAGDKKELERLEGIGRQEAAVNEELVQVRQEISVLEQECAALSSLRAHAAALAAETTTLLGADGAQVGEMIARATADPDKISKVTSRVTDPLQGKGRMKHFHQDLLQYIKGLGPGGVSPTPAQCTGRPWDVLPALTKDDHDALAAKLSADNNTAQAMRMANQLEEWDFDMFRFETACRNASGGKLPAGALFYTCYAVLAKLGLVSKFNLSERCLLQWLSMLEEGYGPQPFHNAVHAADVLQATYHFLAGADGIRRYSVSDADQLALVLAAAMHDFAHPGTNNAFQVRARTPLANLFANESPLEQMHFAAVMELMKLQRYNLLRMVEPTVREHIEDTIGHLLLATDLDRHDVVVAAFRLKLAEWGNASPATLGEGICRGDDSLLVLCMLLKAADVSNCARREDLYVQWATRLQAEHKRQGALESQLGLPPSPFMGTTIGFHTTIAKLQIAFINTVVVPIFAYLADTLPKLRACSENVARNRGKWANAEENEALGRV